jgi:hypothetical protein
MLERQPQPALGSRRRVLTTLSAIPIQPSNSSPPIPNITTPNPKTSVFSALSVISVTKKQTIKTLVPFAILRVLRDPSRNPLRLPTTNPIDKPHTLV